MHPLKRRAAPFGQIISSATKRRSRRHPHADPDPNGDSTDNTDNTDTTDIAGDTYTDDSGDYTDNTGDYTDDTGDYTDDTGYYTEE